MSKKRDLVCVCVCMYIYVCIYILHGVGNLTLTYDYYIIGGRDL